MADTCLAERIIAASKQIGTLAKDGHNDFHDYDYVTEAAVKRAVRDAMVANGLYVVSATHEILPGSEFSKAICRTTVVVGGVGLTETVCGMGIGSGTDKGDKSFYKAMAGGLKYALTSLFLIPTGDDAEANESKPAKEAKAPKAAPKKAEPKEAEVPAEKPVVNATESTNLALKALGAINKAASDTELKEVASALSQNKTKMSEGDFEKVKLAFKAKMKDLTDSKEKA